MGCLILLQKQMSLKLNKIKKDYCINYLVFEQIKLILNNHKLKTNTIFLGRLTLK